MKKITAFLTATAMAAAMTVTNMVPAFATEPTTEQIPSSMPIYVIKNSSNILLTYENGKFSAEKMIATSNRKASPLVNIDGSNYVPFRYLFEKFGIVDANTACNVSDTSETNTLGSVDLADYIKKNKCRGAYVYQTVNGKINIRVLSADGKEYTLEEGKAIDGILDDKKEPVTLEVKKQTINDISITYIPLRALQILNFDTLYDSETDAAFISLSNPPTEPESPEATASVSPEATPSVSPEATASVSPEATETPSSKATKDAIEAYKNLFNDNYATYSYIYSLGADSEPFVLTKDNERCYGVNQYGNMIVYADNNQNIRIRFVDKDETTANEIIREDIPLAFENGETFVVDKVIYDGKKIYGIKVNTSNDSVGKIFSADLTLDDNGTFTARNIQNLNGITAQYLLFKTIKTKVKDDNGYKYEYNRYLYFIDYNDSEKIKRVRADKLWETPEAVLDESGRTLNDISYFDIEENYEGNYYMIYHNYKAQTLSVATFAAENATKVSKIGEITKVPGINGMISNANAGENGYIFYFIKDIGDYDDTNNVVGIKAAGGNYTATELNTVKDMDTAEGVKIRNIAFVGGKLYGRIAGKIGNGDYKEIYE